MNFCPSRFLARLACGAAAAAFSATAQQTIIFSKPADLPANTADASPSSSSHFWGAGAYNAPHHALQNYAPDLPMTLPMPGNNDPSVKEAMDRRRNWTLQTPEQILGIQTPEEILGIAARPGDPKLSLEEQFLQRASQTASVSATNARSSGFAPWHAREEDNPFSSSKNDSGNNPNPFQQPSEKPGPAAKFFSQLLDVQNRGTGPDGKPVSAWNTAFTQPTQPKPTPEQVADMEAFRALMAPEPPPGQVPAPTRLAVTPAPDPFIQPAPAVNPAGRGIEPLGNSFSRPSGISPLPGVSTPPPAPVTVRPAWQAQPPPWMSTGPQPHKPGQNY